jgi:hypothetical protein
MNLAMIQIYLIIFIVNEISLMPLSQEREEKHVSAADSEIVKAKIYNQDKMNLNSC